MWIRSFTIVVVSLAIAAGAAIAQQSVPPSAPGTGTPIAPPQSVAATGEPAVPDAALLLILIRSTLLAVNQANLTGNYTVLRDLGTPDFQRTNSSAHLTDIFKDLRSRNIDLGPIAVLDAKLVRQPSINANGQLRLSGFFPSRPEQVNFDLAFQMIDGRWRLYGIALNTTPNESPVVAEGSPAQPTPAPDSKSEVRKEPVAAATSGSVPLPVQTPNKTAPKKASEKKKTTSDNGVPAAPSTPPAEVASTPKPQSKPPANETIDVNKWLAQ
jgi:hypothetical protein